MTQFTFGMLRKYLTNMSENNHDTPVYLCGYDEECGPFTVPFQSFDLLMTEGVVELSNTGDDLSSKVGSIVYDMNNFKHFDDYRVELDITHDMYNAIGPVMHVGYEYRAFVGDTDGIAIYDNSYNAEGIW